MSAPEQRAAIGSRRRGHAVGASSLLEEAIDRMFEVREDRHRALHREFERPVVLCSGRQLRLSEHVRRVVHEGRRPIVPVSAFVDPRSNRRDLRHRQRIAVPGHDGFLEPGNHTVEETFLGAARHDCRAQAAASQRGLARAQIETGTAHSLAVTVPATPFHDGTDVVCESGGTLGFGTGGHDDHDRQEHGRNQPDGRWE